MNNRGTNPQTGYSFTSITTRPCAIENIDLLDQKRQLHRRLRHLFYLFTTDAHVPKMFRDERVPRGSRDENMSGLEAIEVKPIIAT
jgi:hypothetical protein